jgi:hypothetical protein
MSPHPQTTSISPSDRESGRETAADRVQAAPSGGCVTAHFSSDAEFQRALVMVRRSDGSTQLGSTLTGWRA